MASLKDVQQLTKGLEDLVGQLSSELGNGEVDFSKLMGITDQISEQADGLAETFSNINEALQERIQNAKQGASSGSRQQAKSSSGS
jgi:L-ribulose-5-phosphate 3-epimerase UlaE